MSVPYTGMIGLTPSTPAYVEEEQEEQFSFNSYLNALFSGSPMQEANIYDLNDSPEYAPKQMVQEESHISEITFAGLAGRPLPVDSLSMTDDMLPGARPYVSKEDEWWYKQTAQQAVQEKSLAMKSLDLDNTDSHHRIGESFKNPAAPALSPYPALSPFGPPRREEIHSPGESLPNEVTLARNDGIEMPADSQEVLHLQEDGVPHYSAAEHARAAFEASVEYEKQQRHAAEAVEGPGDWLWGIFQSLSEEAVPTGQVGVQVRPVQSRRVHPQFGQPDFQPVYQDPESHGYEEGVSNSHALTTNSGVSWGQQIPVEGHHADPFAVGAGRSFDVQVGRHDTAGQIRDRVARAAGLAPDSIALAIGGQILHDDTVPSLYEAASAHGNQTQLTVVAAPRAPAQRPQPPQPTHQSTAAVAEAAAAVAVAATPWLAESAPVSATRAGAMHGTIGDTMATTMGSTLMEDTQSIKEAMAALTAELERRAETESAQQAAISTPFQCDGQSLEPVAEHASVDAGEYPASAACQEDKAEGETDEKAADKI